MFDKGINVESIGKEIQEIFRRKGISFYQMSKDLGIAQESLYGSLLDTSNPNWRTVKKVLDYLDYEIRIVKPKRKSK